MRKLVPLLILLFTTTLSNSQTNPQWMHYNAGETTTAIVETSHFLYVGLQHGGFMQIEKSTEKIKRFYKHNSGLLSNQVNDLDVDQQGNLWIGTPLGLCKFDGTNWYSYLKVIGSKTENNINLITADNSGNIWCISWYCDSLIKFDGMNWSHYNDISYGVNFDLSYIEDMVVDKNNTIWLVERNAAVKFTGTSWHYPSPIISPDMCYGDFKSIDVDTMGNIWICGDPDIIGWIHGYHDGGLWVNQNGNWSYIDVGTDYLQDIYIDKNNTKWVLTDSNEIIKINHIDTIRYSNLPDSHHTVVYNDNSNNLWFGSRSKGIYKYKNSNWKKFQTGNCEMPYTGVEYLTIDKDDNKLMLSFNLITLFDNYKWDTVVGKTSPFGKSKNYFDSIGHLWIQTNGGFKEFSDTVWTLYNNIVTNYGIYPPSCYDLTTDTNDYIYAATSDGLYFYNNSTWSKIPLPDTTFYQIVTQVEFDNEGKLWVGFNGKGLAYYANNQWTTFGTTGVVNSSYIERIVIDKNNRIWFGTMDNGIISYDNGTWNHYTTTNSGLISNMIWDMAVDTLGRLYIATIDPSGISIYNDTSWSSLTPYNSFYPGAYGFPTIAIDKYQNLWITTENGLSVYNKNGIVYLNTPEYLKPTQSNEFNLFPNPTNGKFTIELSNYSKNQQIEIYNLSGQLIKSLKTTTPKVQIDLSAFPKGLYFIRVKNGKTVLSKKVVLH
jgi:ligand-binding sensor domain-containing protein